MGVTLALLIIIAALPLGLPVPFCFMLATAFMVVVHGYDPSFLLPYGFSQMSSVVLLAIPLFIMVGGMMDKGGIGTSLVNLVDIVIGRIREGLGVVAVVSSAVLGSISGSGAAWFADSAQLTDDSLRMGGPAIGSRLFSRDGGARYSADDPAQHPQPVHAAEQHRY